MIRVLSREAAVTELMESWVDAFFTSNIDAQRSILSDIYMNGVTDISTMTDAVLAAELSYGNTTDQVCVISADGTRLNDVSISTGTEMSAPSEEEEEDLP